MVQTVSYLGTCISWPRECVCACVRGCLRVCVFVSGTAQMTGNYQQGRHLDEYGGGGG